MEKKQPFQVLPRAISHNETKSIPWEDLIITPNFKETLEKSIIIPVTTDNDKDHKKPKEFSYILFGPPGTGKTTVPYAIAKSLKWDIIYISPETFFIENSSVEYAISKCFQELEEYTKNVVAKKQKENKAREKAGKDLIPETADIVVIFDEIDELVGSRNIGNDRQSRLVTTMMLPLFNELREIAEDRGFIFFALTNHIKRFDPAIKRKGRFDLILPVGPPERAARYLLFEQQIEKLKSESANEEGLVINDSDIIKGMETKTVDLDLISISSARLGFGDIKNVCTRVFEQQKSLLDIEDFILQWKRNKRQGTKKRLTKVTLPSLSTSNFLHWINRQRNSTKDTQEEIERFYEEVAIYARGSSANSELNQIQDKADKEFDSLNISDKITTKTKWIANQYNKLDFEFRNLSENNAFSGSIDIICNGAGFSNETIEVYHTLVTAGKFDVPTKPIMIKPTKSGLLTITYLISGKFDLQGIRSLTDNLATLEGETKRTIRIIVQQP